MTGAGGGLGQWLAAGLGMAGAKVILSDVDPAQLSEVQETCRAAGITCEKVVQDLSQADGPQCLASAALKIWGGVDVLVNNAGINQREAILDVEPGTWDRIAAVNLKAPYFLSQQIARSMREQRRGAIINIGSLNVAVGLEGVSVYGAHKAALSQLTKAMSVEWTRYGIRVNCIAPGFMITPLSRPLWADDTRRDWILERTPMRRAGYANELVGLCQLLASPAGSFITGQTVYADGGWLGGTSWDVEE